MTNGLYEGSHTTTMFTEADHTNDEALRDFDFERGQQALSELALHDVVELPIEVRDGATVVPGLE